MCTKDRITSREHCNAFFYSHTPLTKAPRAISLLTARCASFPCVALFSLDYIVFIRVVERIITLITLMAARTRAATRQQVDRIHRSDLHCGLLISARYARWQWIIWSAPVSGSSFMLSCLLFFCVLYFAIGIVNRSCFGMQSA